MKNKEKIFKNIELGVLIGFIFAVVLSFAGFDSACDNLRSSVLRLHIIANSDSDADQSVKLIVRDEILKSTDVFDNCSDLNSALKEAKSNVDDFKKTAERVLEENGFDYNVNVRVGDSDFGTRDYDGFSLPAGTYKSLIITLGEGKGHNWWCVLFPAVCVPAASNDRLDKSASQRSTEIAEHKNKYIMDFKIVEWYENIKSKF